MDSNTPARRRKPHRCGCLLAALLPVLAATVSVAQDAAPESQPTKEPHVTPVPTDPALAETQAYIQKMTDENRIDKTSVSWRTQLPRFPEVTFTEGARYFWNVKTTEGDVKVRLLPETAPHHAANFIYLTELGFFDGLSFHRVIPGFMAQGGCPLGNGRGGPGYRFAGEFDASVKHNRPGLLSMANAGPNTDGSQFFLTFKATPWLDGKHTIFGEVEEGMDTVHALEKQGNPDGSGRTQKTLRIEHASIEVER